MDAEVIERLTRIETLLHGLVGNGQPGLIAKLEDRITVVEKDTNRAIGWRDAIVTVVGASAGGMIHFLFKK